MTNTESKGDPRFHALLKEMGDLHDSKQQDYGTPEDPFHNLRAAEDFGLPPEYGIALRMNDKMNRIKKYYKHGGLKNESVEDAYMDIAVYALAALVLRRERQQSSDGVCHQCGKLCMPGHACQLELVLE